MDIKDINFAIDILSHPQSGDASDIKEAFKVAVESLKAWKENLEQEPCDDKGDISDGYHTFNQLYHQRAILFATIVNQNKDKAWKSYKHSDGKYCFDSNGEWFIVGIDTPEGSYTYHYSKKYWDMFDCKELECGKEWDGHTEEDVTRLLSLEQEPCEDAISREQAKVAVRDRFKDLPSRVEINTILNELPSVTPSYNSIKTELKSSEDCINIQTVKDQMIKYGFNAPDMTVTEFVEDLPSATPQPKIGKWTRVKDKTGLLLWKCTCGWQ